MGKLFISGRYKNIPKLVSDLKLESEKTIVKRGERMAIRLFKSMAVRVPAYASFLKRRRFDYRKVKTIKDFIRVPTIDKENYLRQYSLASLCWDGKFNEKQWVISTTSGSTGEPFYFPREESQIWQYAGTAEMYLRTNFQIHKQSTLYIDAFPMGAWIGGLFTYEAVRLIAQRGNYKLSIITVGIDKKEIIKSVKKFGKEFDQIIIGCYGPFLKDAIDDGLSRGLKWKDYNLKFVFSAEGFSEDFRDYIAEKTGLDNIYLDTLNHYGTVDQGTLSYETPISILARRLAIKNSVFYDSIFPSKNKLPTLTQYDPELFYFEDVKGSLLCSSYSGIPLVRYDLKDNGGVISFEEMKQKMKSAGLNLGADLHKNGIKNTVWPLPFVYVYERKDFSVSLYAFQIYPETIRKALFSKQLQSFITGKFSMLVKYDRLRDQYLEINVELKREVHPGRTLKKDIKKIVVDYLVKENSEYRKTYGELKKKVEPKIVFWQYEHDKYFKLGTKQKWVSSI